MRAQGCFGLEGSSVVNVALAYAFITAMFCLKNRVGIDTKDGSGGGGRAWCGAISEELGRGKIACAGGSAFGTSAAVGSPGGLEGSSTVDVTLRLPTEFGFRHSSLSFESSSS